MDVFVVPSLIEYDKKPLKSIDKADIEVKPEEANEAGLTESASTSLLTTFKELLLDKVEDVVASKRLVDSAVTLVVGKEGMDSQTERMMKMFNKEYAGLKKIMEVNLSHPLVKNLWYPHQQDSKTPLLKTMVWQLYEARAAAGREFDFPTDFRARMTEIMERATRV